MTSDPPRSPDSTAKYDALFLGLEDEAADFSDVLSDGAQPTAKPGDAGQQTLPVTIAPPMPDAEYVQTMMERADLADPEIPRPPARPLVGDDPLGAPDSAPPTTPYAESPARPKTTVRTTAGMPKAAAPFGGQPRLAPREPTPGPMAAVDAMAQTRWPAPAPVRDDIWQKSRKPGIPETPTHAHAAPEPLDELLFDDLDRLPSVKTHGPARPKNVTPAAPPPKQAPQAPTKGASPKHVAAPAAPLTREAPWTAPDDEISFGDRPTPVVADPNATTDPRVREMEERFFAQDYRAALGLAEAILGTEPSNLDVSHCADECRKQLAEKYLARLGGRRTIPRIVLGRAELRGLALDHRAGFLLSSVDGVMSTEEIIDVSSMPELDALRMMFELMEQGVIVLEPPQRGRRR